MVRSTDGKVAHCTTWERMSTDKRRRNYQSVKTRKYWGDEAVKEAARKRRKVIRQNAADRRKARVSRAANPQANAAASSAPANKRKAKNAKLKAKSKAKKKARRAKEAADLDAQLDAEIDALARTYK